MYLKLHRRDGGFAAIPADCRPCLSAERVGRETFTLVTVPLVDVDYEVKESVDEIIKLLGDEVKETNGTFRFSEAGGGPDGPRAGKRPGVHTGKYDRKR